MPIRTILTRIWRKVLKNVCAVRRIQKWERVVGHETVVGQFRIKRRYLALLPFVQAKISCVHNHMHHLLESGF